MRQNASVLPPIRNTRASDLRLDLERQISEKNERRRLERMKQAEDENKFLAKLAEERKLRKLSESSFLPAVENRNSHLNSKLEELKRQNAEKFALKSLANNSTFLPIKETSFTAPRQLVRAKGELEEEISAQAEPRPPLRALQEVAARPPSRLMQSLPSTSAFLEATKPSEALERSLPSEVRFVAVEDPTRTWYPESPPKSRSTAYRKFRRQRPELKISTTPQSNFPTSSNFFPSSRSGNFPLAIDAGRVVTALKMATDMNPVMRTKYLEFFEDLAKKRQTPKDPFASDEASSESLL
jgi:hypothetical protein